MSFFLAKPKTREQNEERSDEALVSLLAGRCNLTARKLYLAIHLNLNPDGRLATG